MADAADSNLQQLEDLAIGDGDRESSLLMRNVESKELTKVVTRQDLGRIILAATDIDVGYVVIRETPTMVWRHDDWMDLFTAFQALPEESRQGVLNMFHPPLDRSETMRYLGRLALQLKSRSSLDVGTIHKLLAIAATNAHEYIGTNQELYREVIGFDERSTAARSALFLYGSKVAHACSPNTSYTSQTADGKLEYKAIRPIAAGDMVTFSYLEKEYETPTHVRRETLLQSKAFLCKCDRCMGPDYTRQIHCPTCSKFVKCTNDGSGVTLWSCDNCGLIQGTNRNQLEEKEADMRQRIDQVVANYKTNCMNYQNLRSRS
jgi:hypothetical protein